jgi:hypothetical protein
MSPVECRRGRERFVCRVGSPVPPAPTGAFWLCGSCAHAESRDTAAKD